MEYNDKSSFMNPPDWMLNVDSFRMYDPLAEFLGALENGLVEIRYIDCVVLAGHSCPTVAGAYIATFNALKALYKEENPVRGEIKVELSNAKAEGVTGVIGNVASFICGVADEGGFAGIGGKFSRRGKLEFGKDFEGDIKFTRVDNQKSVTLKIDTSIVPGDSRMMPLMQKALQGLATDKEKEDFKELWQNRVKRMLTNKALWDKIAPILN
jgi:hypothetical protein